MNEDATRPVERNAIKIVALPRDPADFEQLGQEDAAGRVRESENSGLRYIS